MQDALRGTATAATGAWEAAGDAAIADGKPEWWATEDELTDLERLLQAAAQTAYNAAEASKHGAMRDGAIKDLQTQVATAVSVAANKKNPGKDLIRAMKSLEDKMQAVNTLAATRAQ